MTTDFIEDFTQALEKEGKFYVIAVFDKDINNLNVVDNLNDNPNQQFTYPDNRKTESIQKAISRGITFALTGEQADPS